MNYPTTFIITAVVCSTAVAEQPRVAVVRPVNAGATTAKVWDLLKNLRDTLRLVTTIQKGLPEVGGAKVRKAQKKRA